MCRLGQATEAINAAQRSINFPTTIDASFQGTAAAFQASLASEPLLILAALVTVYIVLGMLYESYIHPITILSTLPSAGVGAMLAPVADRQRAERDGIDRHHPADRHCEEECHHDDRFRPGNGADTARIPPRMPSTKPAFCRFRPIMMTTMAALLGGLPLALGTGTGSELRRPLGITIVGGLIVSQALTLFTTPVVYLYLDRLRLRVGSKRHAPGPDPVPPLSPRPTPAGD